MVAFKVLSVRQWVICVVAGVLLAVLSARAIWYDYEPIFQAVAWLKIEDRLPTVAFQDRAREESRKFVDTQVQLLRSPLVVRQALNESAVAELDEIKATSDPVEWLRQRLDVRTVGRSELYTVKVVGPTPEFAVAATNAIVNAYLDLREQRDAQETVDQQTLMDMELSREMEEVKLRALEESLASHQFQIPENKIEQMVADDPQLALEFAELKELQAKYDHLVELASKGEKDPRAVKLRADITKAEKRIGELAEGLRQSFIGELKRADRIQHEAQVETLKREIDKKQSLERLFRERIEEQRSNREDLSGLTLDLEFARNEFARAKDVLDRISHRIVAFRTEMRAPSRVSMMQEATQPTQPANGGLSRRILFAVLASFAVPFVLVIGWQLLSRHSPGTLSE